MKYNIVNGTYYNIDTNKKVIDILEQSRISQARIAIVYGDPKTGQAHDETIHWGIVGRSLGPVKVPLLIYNSKCHGGPSISSNCIVEIRTKGKKILYKQLLIV